MPRVIKKKKKPLRGSVRQNTVTAPEEASRPLFGFGSRLALLVLVTIAVILSSYMVWHSTWPQRQRDKIVGATLDLTQRAGFKVADVMVEGRYYTDRDALLGALGIQAGSPIFTFAPQEAYDRIMTLPWTESVAILRSMPNKIIVRLTERQPMARWQHDDQTFVIDRDGKELTAAKPEQFPNLPLVVGNAAPEQTKALLADLRAFPAVSQVLKAAVRVGKRRWNIYIQPNLLVRLPEMNMKEALTKLTQLIQEQKITERSIIAIDLRLPDRMVIEPGTQPAAPQFGEDKE